MNVVVSSSRGRPLKGRLPKDAILNVNPGAKFKALATVAKSIIPPPHRYKNKTHIYFIGGVPDISEKINSMDRYNYKYTESVFFEESDEAVSRLKSQIERTHREIIRMGAIPIFATIPKFRFDHYNSHCLRNNKTSCLLHSNSYGNMQRRANTVIDQINGHISSLNKRVGMSTPFLHDTITEVRGRGKKRYTIYKWELLYDGLHATDDLATKWASVLKNCFAINRKNDESDQEMNSPKRSWRRERRGHRN